MGSRRGPPAAPQSSGLSYTEGVFAGVLPRLRSFPDQGRRVLKWTAPWAGRKAAAAEAQPFAIDCECGQPHTGERRRRYQQIICKECGTALFVLPSNPYPPPPYPKSKQPTERRRRDRQLDEAAARESLSDSVMELPVMAADRFGSFWRRLVGAASRGVGGTLRSVGRTGRGFVDWFTPVKLAVLTLVAVMIAAGTWQVLRSVRQHHQTIVRDLAPDAARAWEEGDIARAAALYGEVAASADYLKLDTPEAGAARVLGRELNVLANLSFETLPEVIEALPEAAFGSDAKDDDAKDDGIEEEKDDAKDGEPDDAVQLSDAYLARLARTWFVWEGPVVRGQLPLPVTIRGQPVRLLADDLPALAAMPDDADEIVLAMQVAGVERSGRGWTVRFDPDTAFLWASIGTYEKLGIPYEFGHERSRVKALLKAQRSWAGAGDDPLPGDAGGNDADGNEEVTADGEPV